MCVCECTYTTGWSGGAVRVSHPDDETGDPECGSSPTTGSLPRNKK